MLDVLAILLSGLVTYVERAIFLVTKKVRPPRRALRYLPLVGPAVLGAIAVPGILAPRGELSLTETIPAVIAAVVAGLAWKWTKQLVIGLVAGLAVWWGLIYLLVQLGWVVR
jgi:branched-subunit amino acid transport protein